MKYFKTISSLLPIFAFVIAIAFFLNPKSGFAEGGGGGEIKQEKTIYDSCTFFWCEERECAVGNDGNWCLEDTPCYDPDTSFPCVWME